ncbi:hypothetical protein K0M31_002285 [Melipona bicolor]|uniref:Uncharacterized protein n=1 Tax=Melipona bicolor TaxID=60889 RepID=A0AA40GH96_9HYME|nr:hypothetical protein K0M31_002285 [Melipona bicolor]
MFNASYNSLDSSPEELFASMRELREIHRAYSGLRDLHKEPEGVGSEQERADQGAGRAARRRSPQDLGPWRESEQQPLQRLVPQPRPADRVQIQDDLPENVVKMNSKREPLLPDIDDAHNAINSNIIKLTMISPEARDYNDAGGFLAASNGKQQ